MSDPMAVWELRCASVDDYAAVVALRDTDLLADRFRPDGQPKMWVDRPLVGFFDSTRPKKPRPPADVSAMFPGALVLNERAKEVLGPFLSKFGQLLELEAPNVEIRYFYNVTNLVPCVDVARSEKNEVGRIVVEAFDMSQVPVEPAVFKDPATALTRVYLNDAGRALVDSLVQSAGLTGVETGRPDDDML
jgi:hypothetical protein